MPQRRRLRPPPRGQPGEQHLGLGRCFAVAGRQQRGAGIGQLLVAGLLRMKQGRPQAEQQTRTFGIVSRPELQGGPIPARGGGERVEGE
jgi:hypothetical protein